MRGIRFAAPLLLTVVFFTGMPSGTDTTAADYTPPATPPPEFQAQFDELVQELTAFEAQLDADWDGSTTDGQFAGAIQASANPNMTVVLLGSPVWTRTLSLLDRFEEMGVRTIKIDVNYPTLTQSFHTYLQSHPPAAIPDYTFSAANFIGFPNSFYNKLVTEIRSRGLGVWVEHGTLFSDYSPTPPSGYFADMRTAGLAATQARYKSERIAESVALVSQLQPDYYTILEEPSTADMNFGDFPGNVPIFDADGWTQLVSDTVSAIDAQAPGSPTLLGAGTGVWDGEAYLTRLVALPELDYFDIHSYPVRSLTTNYLDRLVDWIDYVHATDPEKFVMIGETWTYKTTGAEVSADLDYREIFGRDVYSFWEPIDRQYLDVMYKLMHHKHIKGIMPYWAQYYFAYLTYGDPELEGLDGIQLLGAEGQAAQQAWLAGALTGTGEKFQELLQPPVDADADSYPDAVDNCPQWANGTQALPSWAVPPGDSDCDAFTDTSETFSGTASGAHCAATSTANDEASPDAWPVDSNDDQKANVLDVSQYSSRFGSSAPGPPYAVRYDFNGDGIINVLDVSRFSSLFGKSCSP